MGRLIVCLIIVLLESLSFANDRWDKVFPGTRDDKMPAGYNFYDMGGVSQVHPEGFLVWMNSPPECNESVLKMGNMVREYSRAAFYNKQGDARAIYSGIQNHLFRTLTESHPCFLTTAKAYSIASMSILDRYSGSDLPFLMVLLQRNGNLKFITPSFRDKLGGIYKLSNKKGKTKVLGAYECAESAIYLDITLPPYDLAGAFVHELDHLFRDKYVDSQFFPHNPEARIIIDEALAATHTAFVQRRLEGSTPPFGILAPLLGMKRNFRTGEDRSLYSYHGDFEKLWRGIEMGDNAYNTKADTFLTFSFLRKPMDPAGVSREPKLEERHELFLKTLKDHSLESELSLSVEGAAVVNKHVHAIYGKVSKAYFGRKLTETLTRQLSPSANSLHLSPLTRWVEAFSILDDTGLNTSIYDLKIASENLLERLSSRSKACVDFHRSINAGELNDYIGNTLIPGTDSIKPGTDTIKPGTDTIKPGTDTIKPGTDTIKPGTDTIKPGTDSIKPLLKPCIHPDF